MMRGRNRVWRAVLLALVVVGCEQTAAPVRRDILGSWIGTGVPGVSVQMTVAETARSVDGAGGWTEGETAHAFRVFGALARDEVSLYFDFDGRADLTFQGYFSSEDRIEGTLNGGGYRNQEVSFAREDLGG